MFSKASIGFVFCLVFLAACSQSPVNTGETLLTKQDFGTAVGDYAEGLAANSKGVYVVGYTNGSLDGVNKGSGDAFLRKYNGGVVWAQQFGSREFDDADKVAVDAAGNSYVVGSTSGAIGFKVGSTDIFLRKYNSSGVVQWTRQFGTTGVDNIYDVALDASNNVFVLGDDENNSNGFEIRKFSSSGTLLTTKAVNSSALPNLFPNALAVDSTGAVVVLGEWFGSAGGTSWNVRVFKFTNALADVWNVPFQQTANSDYAYDIATFGTDIYVTADVDTTTYGARYGKLNSAGTTLSVKRLEPTATCNCTFPKSIVLDSTGNIYIAAETSGAFTGFTNAGDRDIVVFKYSSNHARAWVRQFGNGSHGSTSSDYASAIAVSDAVYVTGFTFGNLLGDPKYGVNDSDAYLAQLDPTTGAILGIDQ